MLASLFAFARARSAQAAPARPFSYTGCSGSLGSCIATLDFSGRSDHGAQTTVETSTPGYSGSNAFYKYLEIDTDLAWLQVGMESNGWLCGSGNHYFYIVGDMNGSEPSKCFSIPTGDDNQDVLLKVSYYVSNGGGWFIWIDGHNGYQCAPTSCTYNAISDSNSSSYVHDIYYYQQLTNGSFTGHAIWGTDWVNNEYFSGTGSWHYYPSGIPYAISLQSNGNYNGPPPQMYWPPRQTPDGSFNNGGVLYSCDYDSGSTCTIGS